MTDDKQELFTTGENLICMKTNLLSHFNRWSFMRSVMLFGMGLAFASGSSAVSGESNSVGKTDLVLDTGSFWRCHQTLRDRIVGSGPDAKSFIGGRANQKMHWNSEPPPADWMQPEFDDGAWWRAPGPFYGNPGTRYRYEYGFLQPEAIALICLRGKFGVDDPGKVRSLTFSAAYRGGIVVYLNGKEIKRANMPEGKIDFETLAEEYPREAYVRPDGAVLRWGWGDPDKNKDRLEMRIRRLEKISLPVENLRKGMNVLSIEIHRSPYIKDFVNLDRNWEGFQCHAGLLSAQLRTDSPGAIMVNVKRPAGFQVWNANPMMAIFDMDYGDSSEELHPIYIAGARNGAFSGQVVVSSDQAIKGLKAEIGGLKLKEVEVSIPPAAIQIRYAQPGGQERDSAERYGTGEVSRFDVLAETPLDEVPVYNKASGKKPYGAVQPIWVTVNVPADAKAGEYRGKLTIKADGQKDVEVPVRLVVSAFKLPAPKDHVTFVDMIESPESVALCYEVPLWSEKHWALIDRTFQQLARIGNKTAYIPLICKTHFGNSESMVRWVKQADGSYKGDFSIMEKYLDIVQKHLGNPEVVCFYGWDHFVGGSYLGRPQGDSQTDIPVSLLKEDGTVETIMLPRFETPGAQKIWKPVADELRERMKKRGLEKSIMVGIGSDVRPGKPQVEFWKSMLPEAKWVIHSHPNCREVSGVPVGYAAVVWMAAFAQDPEIARTYGWRRDEHPNTPKGQAFAHFNRDMVFGHFLTEFRLLAERNISGRQAGFGRNGADFWPVLKDRSGRRTGMLAGRYPESNWRQLNLKTCLLAPGPDGAISTVRWEMMIEGVQESEARIVIEKALLDPARRATLGEKRAVELQDMLDKRTRASTWGWDIYGWYVSSGWQEDSAKLFAAAGAVANTPAGK